MECHLLEIVSVLWVTYMKNRFPPLSLYSSQLWAAATDYKIKLHKEMLHHAWGHWGTEQCCVLGGMVQCCVLGAIVQCCVLGGMVQCCVLGAIAQYCILGAINQYCVLGGMIQGPLCGLCIEIMWEMLSNVYRPELCPIDIRVSPPSSSFQACIDFLYDHVNAHPSEHCCTVTLC